MNICFRGEHFQGLIYMFRTIYLVLMSTFHKFILGLLLSTVNVGEANKDVTQHQGIRAALNRASIEFAQFTLSSYHIYYAYFQNMINDANMQ